MIKCSSLVFPPCRHEHIPFVIFLVQWSRLLVQCRPCPIWPPVFKLSQNYTLQIVFPLTVMKPPHTHTLIALNVLISLRITGVQVMPKTCPNRKTPPERDSVTRFLYECGEVLPDPRSHSVTYLRTFTQNMLAAPFILNSRTCLIRFDVAVWILHIYSSGGHLWKTLKLNGAVL